MHGALVFKLLAQDECDILSSLATDDWQLLRRIILEMILATDMGRHFEMLGTFKAKYLSTTVRNLDDFEERLSVLKL
jgi:hypothetical protein